MNSIIEEEKDSELNESNFSMSRVSREFIDSLAISNSFENVLKKLFQFEEKKNQYEFNNFKNFGKIANKGIYNKNNKESNNIIENNNSISNNSDECDISESIKKITFKNILLKKEDDEKKEEIFNDKIKKDKIRDINDLKNEIHLYLKNININNNNNSYEFSKSSLKNDSFIDEKSGSKSEPKSNSFSIYNNININQKEQNLNNTKIDYSSSNTSPNIKEIKQPIFNEIKSTFIKNINNTMNNEVFEVQENNLILKQNNINCSFNNGNYKFSFEIIQKNKEKININIELGFRNYLSRRK